MIQLMMMMTMTRMKVMMKMTLQNFLLSCKELKKNGHKRRLERKERRKKKRKE